MDQYELTRRLLDLKMKKREFSEMLGIHPATLYHWKETPRYVEKVLELVERVRHLEGNMFRKRES